MTPPEGRDDLSVGERALRLAVLTLPHLSGLARTVRWSRTSVAARPACSPPAASCSIQSFFVAWHRPRARS